MSTNKYEIIKNALGNLADEIASCEGIYTANKAMNVADSDLHGLEENIINKKLELNTKRAKCVLPSEIYKFVSLDDNEELNSMKLNSMKFKSLENDSIWFSTADKLNDPYEFRASSLMSIKAASNNSVVLPTGETLIQTGKDFEDFCREWDDVKKHIHVACFVNRAHDNLPFWAHYAGNSRGFCLKYEIIEDIYLHKVKYVKSRISADSMFTVYKQAYDDVENLANRTANREKLHQDIRTPFTDSILSHAVNEYITKHDSWEYENEYRLLKKNDFDGGCASEDGGLAGTSECGLRLKAIYIGLKCEKEHVDKLKEIAKSKDISITQCEIDDEGFILFKED